MINFFYVGYDLKKHKSSRQFGYRRSWSCGKDYGGFNNTDCDFCHDVYDRRELCYVTTETEYDNDDSSDNLTWTVKLCISCLNVIIQDNEIRNFKRLGICKEEVDLWEGLNNNNSSSDDDDNK